MLFTFLRARLAARLTAGLLAGLCSLGAVAQPSLQALPPEVTTLLARAKVPPDALAVLVVDAAPGLNGKSAPLLSWRADAAMNPASVMKLVTTYAGLELLGPSFTWATPVYVDGTVAGGVLQGNLVIQGRGDPKLVQERLWLLLRRVQGLGIQSITGDILLDRSAFAASTQNAADFDGEPQRPYNVVPDALLLNFKTVAMTFTPNPGSGSASVSFEPPLAGVQMQTRVPLLAGQNAGQGSPSLAACGDYRAQLKADFTDPYRMAFNGSYPVACGEKVWAVAYADPASYAERAVAGMWQEMGGKLGGRVREGSAAPGQAPAFEIASPPLAAASTPSGAGTWTLRLGTIDNGTFTAGAATPTAIKIPTGATLQTVAAAINAAATGVTAYVASGTDGARLVVKGGEGAASAFVIEAAEDPLEPGLAALAWTPAEPTRLLASAADARFRLDGLERSAASNVIPDAAPGLSLTLSATNPGAPTTIRFSDPGAAIGTAMQDLTAAFNEIAGALGQAIDPKSGPLARDPGALALRRELSQLASAVLLPTAAEGTPRSLSELGLATNRDGSFRFDPALLQRALSAAPAAVTALFTPGLRGVFATIDRIARNASVVGDPGSLGGSVARYAALKTKLADDRAKLDTQLESVRAQFIKRFAASDVRVGASRSTLSFLQNQIAAWNAKT